MFFTEISKFPDPIDERIEVFPFLKASEGIVKFVELLGTVFLPVKNDIAGNIEKLSKIHQSDTKKFSTLNDIFEYELKESNGKVGIDALVWLKRALEYVNVFLTCLVLDHNVSQSTDNLVPFFNKAYEEKLKPYHGWFVQKLFGLMVHAAPSKKSLLDYLASEKETVSEDEIIKGIENFLPGLGANLAVINKLYEMHDLDASFTA